MQDFDGDPAADVAALYRRTWPRLIGVLVSIGGSRADAEEVAQDAYVKLLSRWDTICRYDDPAAWVRAVAVRTLVSRLRRQQVATRTLAKLRGRPTVVRGPDGDAMSSAAGAFSWVHAASVTDQMPQSTDREINGDDAA